jgi:ribonucleoside-diphosphate reductase alpha chain
MTSGATALVRKTEVQLGTIEETLVQTAPVAKKANDKASQIIEARMKGYEGESCSECANFTMVRNGTCLKCDTCGATNGCS